MNARNSRYFAWIPGGVGVVQIVAIGQTMPSKPTLTI
jgi:hypothetical protein